MTDMAYKIPSNSYEMLEFYAKNEGIKMTDKKITKLRSTIKRCLKNTWSFSDKEWAKIDECLKNISSDEFIAKAHEGFHNFYNQALKSNPSLKATLDNNKSDFNQFFSWLQKQNWFKSLNKYEKPERAPRTRTGKSLCTQRRSKGKNLRKNTYSLKEAQRPKHIVEQVEKLRVYTTAKVDPTRLRKEDSIRSITFQKHEERIWQFSGWFYNELAPQFESIKAELVSEKIEANNREIEQNSQNQFSEQDIKTIEQQLEYLTLSIFKESFLLRQYVSWGINNNDNGYGWARSVYSTAIFVVKHLSALQGSETDNKQIINNLREERRHYERKYRSQVKKTKDEKILTPDQIEVIIQHLWQCTAERNFNGRKRSEKEIIRSWIKFLIILLLYHYPIRSREIRELEWGRNFKFGWNSELSCSSYYCEQEPEDKKNGQGRKWFFDPNIFVEVFDEWFKVWRPKAKVEHNFVFFMYWDKNYQGEPFTGGAFGSLVKRTIYAACRDLKAAAEEELENLQKQGKSETDLPQKYKLFLNIEPKRTNAHFFRHLGSTEIRRGNASASKIKAFHNIIGNSVQQGDTSYNILEPEEETQAAVSWRTDLKLRENLANLDVPNTSVNVEIMRILTVLKPKQAQQALDYMKAILTPEQQRELGLI
jgi:hypothetical protein